MTIRTTSKVVTFSHPFSLDGLDDMQPAGSYEVETDEELMEDVSFLGYRRIATLIHLRAQHDRPGVTQTMVIDPGDLERALITDRGEEAADPQGKLDLDPTASR
ncbi:MAG: hypothetical protein ABWY00_11610 [Dongiaceae bacterium]